MRPSYGSVSIHFYSERILIDEGGSFIKLNAQVVATTPPAKTLQFSAFCFIVNAATFP